MADRRRINGPVGGTLPPIYVDGFEDDEKTISKGRSRLPESIRKIFLKTGATPSASGSAYLEIESSASSGVPGPKLSCTVHGPRALPRSTPFSPHMILSAHVKYAPFATKQRRGYLRDSTERDLSTHLETALRGVIIADRWPKSGVDVIISVIEGEQDRSSTHDDDDDETWNTMNILSGCITVACAALADAGIDCVDTIAGGVAALVTGAHGETQVVTDPLASEHHGVTAACCVAYLPQRDEYTNLWFKGRIATSALDTHSALLERATWAAKSANRVLVECLNEAAMRGG